MADTKGVGLDVRIHGVDASGNTVPLLVDSAGTPGGSAAAADTKANVTTSLVQSFLSAFNGATWDRVRSGIKTVGGAITGYLNTIPVAHYNTTQATRTNGQSSPLEADAKGNLATVLGAERTTYTAPYYEGDIVGLTGSALAVDTNDPNTTPPAANRTWRLTSANLAITGTTSIIGDGNGQSSTITLQPWYYDDTLTTWFKLGIVSPASVGNWSSITTVGGALIGMKVFMQITANPGSWKAFKIHLR
jgi:hypothetical protein